MTTETTEKNYATNGSTRGFGPKLTLIVNRLNEKGTPPNLRPVELHKWVWHVADELGYSSTRGEHPSRTTIDRTIIRL